MLASCEIRFKVFPPMLQYTCSCKLPYSSAYHCIIIFSQCQLMVLFEDFLLYHRIYNVRALLLARSLICLDICLDMVILRYILDTSTSIVYNFSISHYFVHK